MASLSTKTKLYIEDNSETWDDTKVSLQDDGSGPYIKTLLEVAEQVKLTFVLLDTSTKVVPVIDACEVCAPWAT